MRIDDREVEARGSVLDACRAAGRDVPALCTREGLSRGGHCRACIVEVDGYMVAACCADARDGMVVRTDTEALRAYRQDLAELMLSEAMPQGRARDVLAGMGVVGDRYARHVTAGDREERHPYLRIDLSACIRCRLCMRACNEVQGQFVYAFEKRGAEAKLSWGPGTLAEAGCVSCGACVAACPSEAIVDRDRARPAREALRLVRTTCGYCGVGCQLEVHATEDAIHHVDGVRDAPVNHGHLCVKGRYAHAFVRHPERLTTPLVRKQGELVPVSWDEALGYVARELTRLRGHVAGLSSSRCTNEENYLLQKWFRAGFGTHDVDCCARVCHAPSAAGLRAMFGTGAATGSLTDIEHADMLLVIGANTTESHPVTGARVKQAALRGVPLVVIDPRATELAHLADVHLKPRPGTNVPLLHSIAHVLLEEHLVDAMFIGDRTEGYQEYERFVRGFSPEAMQAVTGADATLVRRAARIYGQAKRPMEMHGLGVTEHHQGTEAVMAICNLALLRGALGRTGTGVNPLRGQNNVQGAADMGCQPDRLTGYGDPNDAAVRARYERVWSRPLPERAGRTLPQMYEAMLSGELRGLFVLGEDLVQTDPDTRHVRDALSKLELLVVQELFLTDTASLAHVVLPGASFYEKDGTFTNGERRIQRVRKVLEPLGGTRSDTEILLELMARTGYDQPFRSPAEIMDEIAQVAPSFAGVSYARLESSAGLQWPVPSVDHVGTSTLHAHSFAHRERARFACVPYVPSPSLHTEPGELLLITGRVLEHYNNGSMTRRTDNRALRDADLFQIHPQDAHARGIGEGDPVCIVSERGRAYARAHLCDDVAAGTAFLSFHFPETQTNAVTTQVRDRIADCPEYKLTRVQVSRA